MGSAYTRDELNDLWGYGGRAAFSRGVFTPDADNKIVLFVTQKKRSDKTQYKDHISDELLFWEGEERHGSDARIVSADDRGDEILLFYRNADRLPFAYLGLVRLLWHELRTESPSQFVFGLTSESSSGVSPLDDWPLPARSYPLPTTLSLTVRETTIEARRGQAQFRQALLDRWGYRCAVSGVAIPEILRASHIKSWSDSNAAERLNPANGLLLAPQYDALFDRGFVSFRPDGSICLAQHLAQRDLGRLGVSGADRLVSVPTDSQPFLAQHRAIHRFDVV